MTYYTPDLTGTDPDYKTASDIYWLSETNVTLDFPEAIYANSLVIAPIKDQANPLVLGVDYTFNPSDYAHTVLAKARNASGNFTASLVKSVTIIADPSKLPVQVTMSYQNFYLRTPSVPESNSTGTLNLTPDLISQLLSDVAAINQQILTEKNKNAMTSAIPAVLSYDINGTNPLNNVSKEEWDVDTFNSQSVIFPVQGAFFKDTVSVFKKGVATPLVYGTDYQIYGINFALTKLSTNDNGIFSLIQITTPYAGKVEINYHAVGGQVTTDVVGGILTNIQDIKAFLSGQSYLTADNLSQTLAFKTMQSAIKELTDQMRTQLNGNPTYGDSTNGQAITKQIRAADTNVHWWTVASLYKVAGSSDISRHDRMSLHINMKNIAYMADVDIAFNQDQAVSPVTITARNVVCNPGFTLFGDTSLTDLVVPMFRVIWNKDTGTTSGALLQIGMILPSLTESLTIEDRSGVESTWVLDLKTGSDTSRLSPMDDAITLPDGASTWSTTGGMSTQVQKTLGNNDGYLVYVGSQSFVTLDDTAAAALPALTSQLPNYFRLQDIKAFRVYSTDVLGRTMVTDVPVSPVVTNGQAYGTAPIALSVTENNPGTISITITPSQTATASALALRLYGTALPADHQAIRYITAIV